MSPKFCPKCGAPLKPGQEFCVNCGTKLDDWQDLKVADFDPKVVEEDLGAADPTLVNEKTPLPRTRPIPGAANPEPDPDDPVTEDVEPDPIMGEAHDAPSRARHSQGTDGDDHAARHHGQHFDVIDPSQSPVMSPISVDPAKDNLRKSDAFWAGNTKVFVAIVAAAIVILILIFAAASCGTSFNDPQRKNISDHSDSATVPVAAEDEDSSASDSSKSDDSSSSDQSDSDEANTAEAKAERKAIKAYSDKLKDYRDQVDDAVSTYLDQYSADRDQREAEQQKVQELLTNLQTDLDANNSLAYTQQSAYYAQWTATTNCYTDLVTVTQKVADAWKRDLMYNYPSYYPERLEDPFKAETEQGGDIYQTLADYDANHDQIKFDKS